MPAVETRVFLIRHGVTSWHGERRLLGRQKDLALSAEGVDQAERAAGYLAGITLGEVISSPLQRAMQTAQIIGERFAIEIARDPRLSDFDVGDWAGMGHDQIRALPEYAAFLANPAAERIPGGENLEEVRRRAVAAIEQALEDNPSGDVIAVVTHSGVIRVLLAHYLGSALASYHRLSVAPGSVSVLAFSDDRGLPRILAINATAPLAALVAPRAAP